jgi:hypothetical protein
MSPNRFVKASGALVVLALIVAAAAIVSSARMARAVDDDDNSRDESRIRRGFEIAPVPLNLAGKNHALVGLGSYIVNAQIPCNDCHSAGAPTQFAPNGNPYMGQTPVVNPKTYLGGGRDFGAYPPPSGPIHIVSRNLTPDKTGLPEGGNTFNQFLTIMRTGADLDHLHPNCSLMVTTNCVPLPFRGDLLQIMPWPEFQNMTEHDLRAIYEYLSAIPCIEGPATPGDLPPALQYAFPALHNDCK